MGVNPLLPIDMVYTIVYNIDMTTNYVRIKLNNTIKRPFWAQKVRDGCYIRCNDEGETNSRGKLNVIIAAPEDIAWEKPAIMSNKYAELELKGGTS
jgi:hypothetical protein